MDGLFASVEGVGLLIQAVGAILIALLCGLLARVERHGALRAWTLGWASLGAALLALLVEQGVPATASWTLPAYVFGEFLFGLALVVGCARFAGRAPDLRRLRWGLLPAAVYAVVLPQVIGSAFVRIFLAQSVMLAVSFGLAWVALPPRSSGRGTPGLAAMRLALAALTLLFVAYVPVFGLHVLRDAPLPMTALRLSSAAHLVLEFVLGFGAALMVLERAHRDLDAAHQQLRSTSERDELTQVLNRRALAHRLEAVLQGALRAHRQVTLFYLDVDHFKAINDRHGHAAGDRLLVTVAERLQGCVRAEDLVVRMGGDEFVVVTAHPADRGEAATLALRISDALRAPVELAHGAVAVQSSLGIACFPHDASSADELLECADLALYAVKEAGRNDHRFFDAEDAALKAAAASSAGRGLMVVYRPVIDLRSGRLVGLDALAAGRSDSGLGPLRTVCAHLRDWQADLRPLVPVSLHVSTRQLQSRDFVTGLTAAFEEAAIDPALLRLDVDESTIAEGGETVAATLRQLDAARFRLGLTSVGAGTMGLAALRHLPFTAIIFDRAFSAAMIDVPRDATIASGIVQIARRLGIAVQAIDVEAPSQVVALVSLGVDSARGAHFHDALPADACGRLLEFERQVSPREAPRSGASRSPSGLGVADTRT